MGLEFEIRNIRKFDDDLKLICACYAARAESMENIPICAPRLLLRSPANCGTLTSAPGTAKKYFAGYKDVPACSGVEQYNLQSAEVDANTFAAALMPAMLGAPPLLIGVPCTVKAAINARQNGIYAICSILSPFSVCYAQMIKISTYAE